ncbi:hypothetical protein [Gracilimonas sediminicola]|uniref:Flagellar hook-length control protein FliK n=1 Tax=Gracilimonas sediminicola TaxID=2952158 RepID=A0A9X2L3V4_9BACT|nr:hypothetical protein [Gracilimonas sediminicola]MCP9291891.1 hypothetical protein [Gracilimonas sediminicola]
MIKQLLSSAGSSKEAGLATNITKTPGAEGDQASPGLFGSILKTVQGFGQQAESDNTSSKKEKGLSEEAPLAHETTPAKVEVTGDEKVAVQEQVENEQNQEVTEAEKEVKIPESKPAESKSNSQVEKEHTVLTDAGEKTSPTAVEPSNKATEKNIETAGSAVETEDKSDASTISKPAKAISTPLNSEGNAEVTNTTEVSEAKNADQVVKPAAEQVAGAGEAKAVEPGVPKMESSVKSGSEVTETSEGGNTTKTTFSVKEKVSESEIELQEAEGDSSKTSSTNNVQNQAPASPLVNEGAAPLQKNQKVAEQVSANIQKQQVEENSETNETEPEAKVDVTKQAMRAATGQTTTGTPELNQGIQSQKAEEVREKRFRENYAFSGRQELTSERLDVITQGRDTKAPVSFLSQLDVPVQAIQNQMSPGQNSAMTTEQELMLKEYLKESVEMTEQKDTSNALFARMGEMPVSNMLVRRTVMPSLTQAVQKTISAGKATPETWQKHSFELEDGNSIQLSTRQVDGVLQVKLATTSVELSRLMQQYEQEIKQHLEQECQLDVNLQFDGGEQGQEMSGFFGNSSSSRQKSPMIKSGAGNEQATARKTEQNLQQTVRRFGYNQMEWTA